MPANLTPQYIAAEAAYKEAKTTQEKILALEEMMAVIPKHKGTEKLQADIKSRLAKLRQGEEAEHHRSKGIDPFRVECEGAGQIVLVGFPNVGKSSIVGLLTKARVTVGDYPFTTALPLAGMMPFDGIQIQLVDTPPIVAGEMPTGLAGTLRMADKLLVVVDLSTDECLGQMEDTLGHLRDKRILVEEEGDLLPHTKSPADLLFVGNKADAEGSAGRLAVLEQFLPQGCEIRPVSTKDKKDLAALPARLFSLLDVVRVYSKIPGKEVDREAPFTLKRGGTILDLAAGIHRDFPDRLKNARVWGSSRFPGQSVQRDYVLSDGDIVELHVG